MEERQEKNRRLAKGCLLVGAFVLVLWVGALIGGGIVYGVMRWTDLRAGLPGFSVPREGPLYSAHPLGAVVVEVLPDTPAEQSGLQVGDVIVAVDGQQLGFEGELVDLIAEYEPGDRVTLEVERPGEGSRRVRLQLAEDPDREGHPYLGVRYASPLRQWRQRMEQLPLDEPEGFWFFDGQSPLDKLPLRLDKLREGGLFYWLPRGDDGQEL